MTAVKGAAVIVAVVALIVGALWLSYMKKRHGLLVMIGRWHTGATLDGQRRTNATWTRPATKALHVTGHAHRWHWQPGWRRAAIRWGAEVALALLVLGWAWARALTVAALMVLAALVIAGVVLQVIYKVGSWRHEREYVNPLEATLTYAVGVPPVAIEIERAEGGSGVERVALEWAPEVEIGPAQQDRISEAVETRLAIEAPVASWQVTGRNRSASFTRSAPSPARVVSADIRRAIEEAAEHEIVMGLGKKGDPVVVSVDNDSPHLGLSMGSGDGKALALDTRIPAPAGWTTMGDIKAGDVVYDEAGAPCTVTNAWPVRYDRRCCEVEFSDGSVIVADAEHQWLTETLACRRTIRTDRPAPAHPRSRPEVVTTEAMARTLRHGLHNNHSVRVAAPLQCPDANLPVSPYTLGAWLGDGTTADGSITSADPEIISEIEAEGWVTRVAPSTVRERHARYCVRGLTPRLREAGVLGDKHIPGTYLRASEDQRRALLAGLLDTDGHCDNLGRVAFYSTRERLARDVYHLVATLGYKATIGTRTARLYGKDCGAVWTIHFTTADKVFHLPRKLARQVTTTRLTAGRRYVTAVRPVPSVAVRCIAVDSPSHLYLAGETCIPTHNSTVAKNMSCQILHHGALLMVLDIKLISHMWARGLPNVSYAGTPAEIEAALVWLAAEVSRRNRVALAGADVEGTVHADVGPRILLIAEELNATQNRLKAWWNREMGEKGRSPGSEALDEVMFLGRQVRMNVLQIGQRLSVKASGSGDARENLGVLVFADPTAAAWKMLCPQHAQPPASGHLGRIQVVTRKAVREAQGAYWTGAQARAFATSGTVAVPPSNMPNVTSIGPVPVPGAIENSRAEQEIVLGQAPFQPSVPGAVTLREAAEAGLFKTVEAARKAAQRHQFPVVGERDRANLYDIGVLRAHLDGRATS